MPKEGVGDENHEYRVADYLRDVGALWCLLVFADVSSLLCLPKRVCSMIVWVGLLIMHAHSLFEIQQ